MPLQKSHKIKLTVLIPAFNEEATIIRILDAVNEQAIDGVHQSGAKVVMTTHDLGQAHRLADEVLFLHHGRLVESGPAADFFTAPRSREAAAFLAGELLW